MCVEYLLGCFSGDKFIYKVLVFSLKQWIFIDSFILEWIKELRFLKRIQNSVSDYKRIYPDNETDKYKVNKIYKQ